MRVIIFSFALLLTGIIQPASARQGLTQEEQKYLDWAKQIWDSLDRQQGLVELPNGVATLNVPEQFYYLDPDDAQKVLVEVWNNPPGQKKLGMLFPVNATPFDAEVWGVEIDYEQDGYVSDENADTINYDELLVEMRQSIDDANSDRIAAGYDKIQLLGWATKPYYDKSTHKLHWAKELRFGDQQVSTLNYNIRILGRKGVLLLNFIANMDQKPDVEANLNTVLSLAEFNDGWRYEDFDPDMDQVAAYGIGALVAGKVIAKTGLIAVLIVFLKKFGVIMIIGIGAVLSKLFKRSPRPS